MFKKPYLIFLVVSTIAVVVMVLIVARSVYYVCMLIIVFEDAHSEKQIYTFQSRQEWTRNNLFCSIASNIFLLWLLRNDVFHSHLHPVKPSEELHLSVVVFVSSLSPVWSGGEKVSCSYPQPLSTTPTAPGGTDPGQAESKTTVEVKRERWERDKVKKIKEQISKVWRD